LKARKESATFQSIDRTFFDIIRIEPVGRSVTTASAIPEISGYLDRPRIIDNTVIAHKLKRFRI